MFCGCCGDDTLTERVAIKNNVAQVEISSPSYSQSQIETDKREQRRLQKISDTAKKAEFEKSIVELWASTGSIYNTALKPSSHRGLSSHEIAQFDVVDWYFITISYMPWNGKYGIKLEESLRMSFLNSLEFRTLSRLTFNIRECKMIIYDLCNPTNKWDMTHSDLP